MFIFERERQTECEHVRGRERERGRHRIRIGSRLCAVSTEPNVGLKLKNVRS